MIVVACIAVCRANRTKARNTEAGVGIPMSTITTSASHTAQPGVAPNQPAGYPYPPTPLGYTPDSTNPAVSSCSSYPYPLESPPPYPGEETVPQYPLPGQLYPWQQSSGSAQTPESR